MNTAVLLPVAAFLLLLVVGFFLVRGRRPRAEPESVSMPFPDIARSETSDGWEGAVQAVTLREHPPRVLAVLAEPATPGPDTGADAARRAADAFLAEARREESAALDPVDLLDAAMKAADEAVRGLSADGESPPTAALSAVLLDDDRLHWTAAGATRVLLVRDAEVHQATLDHTLATLLADSVARGQLSPEEAPTKQNRHALTSVLGGQDPPEVDRSVRPFLLRPEDVVALCTATVHRAVEPAELAARLNEGANPAGALLIGSSADGDGGFGGRPGAVLVLTLDAGGDADGAGTLEIGSGALDERRVPVSRDTEEVSG